jgi:hypothetical protein
VNACGEEENAFTNPVCKAKGTWSVISLYKIQLLQTRRTIATAQLVEHCLAHISLEIPTKHITGMSFKVLNGNVNPTVCTKSLLPSSG